MRKDSESFETSALRHDIKWLKAVWEGELCSICVISVPVLLYPRLSGSQCHISELHFLAFAL